MQFVGLNKHRPQEYTGKSWSDLKAVVVWMSQHSSVAFNVESILRGISGTNDVVAATALKMDL